jgi:hypothetical protein
MTASKMVTIGIASTNQFGHDSLKLPQKKAAKKALQTATVRFCHQFHKTFFYSNPDNLRPGVDLIKLFWSNLLTLLYKLDHFINISNIYCIFMKRSSLQNRVSKFTPKKFYEIDPWSQCYKAFYGRNLRIFAIR